MPHPQNLRVLGLLPLLSAACHGPAGTGARPHSATDPHGESFRVAMERQMPAMDGKRLKLSVYEVTYQPGGYSTPHRHTCPVIGYVTAGALRSQSAGGRETVYRAGDAFYEEANKPHLVSADASKSEPVTFLAFFLCDKPGPQTVDDSAAGGTRGR
jgi:quercetin dioxygenase-like cupin family protein